MEYLKITNLLNDSSNKTSKFRTKNWVETNDESNDDYSDVYNLVKGKITITGAGDDERDER